MIRTLIQGCRITTTPLPYASSSCSFSYNITSRKHAQTAIMSTTESDAGDAITKDEITGGPAPAPPSPPPAPETGAVSQGTKRDAFTELMSPKPPKVPVITTTATATTAPSSSSSSSYTHARNPRDALSAYAERPEAFPSSRVVFHDAAFVAVSDLYPKASAHVLLIPRAAALRRLHPLDAFAFAFAFAGEGGGAGAGAGAGAPLLASARARADQLKRLVAKELQRRFGAFSALDRGREAALNGEVEVEVEVGGTRGEKDGSGGGGGGGGRGLPALPPGRDWEAEVLVGVHLHPSMNDLHVHVVSRDMHSACLKHRRHYNSFNTPFLVGLDELPLAADDPRLLAHREGKGENYLRRDLRCWRCGRNFGNKFKQLKEHLEVEFEEWKRE